MRVNPEMERKLLEMADEPKKRGRSHPPPPGHPWAKPRKAKPRNDGPQKLFCALCVAHDIPAPDYEYEFHPARKWRVDYVFDGWLVLEVEGGVWKQGRHVRGQGFLDDIEKYNELTIAGYSLIRCTPADIESGSVFPLIKRALGALEEQS